MDKASAPPHSPSLPAGSASHSGAALPAAEIRAEGLGKIYGQRAVVNGVDLRVRAGEIVGLLGPNGAGKTTTFYMIVGLVAATRGRVLLDGRDITRRRMHERARLGLGYLPQEASTFRKLTVAQNILAIVEAVGIPRRQRADIVARSLEEFHLTALATQPAYTLSGGERRRLEIARALVTNPKFLLLDEPFAAIDPISVAEVQHALLQLKARGLGIIITDHNVRETLRVVDRAYLLHQGRVLAEGDASFLINDPQTREIYLGKDFNL
jgi:lipopolysaccharide export system ATP-binding protein